MRKILVCLYLIVNLGCGGGIPTVTEMSSISDLVKVTCYDGSTAMCRPAETVTCNNGQTITCPSFSVSAQAYAGSCSFASASAQYIATQHSCWEYFTDQDFTVGCANFGGTFSSNNCSYSVGDGRCEYQYYDNLKAMTKRQYVYYKSSDLQVAGSIANTQGKAACKTSFDPIPSTQTIWSEYNGTDWVVSN